MKMTLLIGLGLCAAAQWLDLPNPYLQLVAMYIGINIILTLSLNLVNGYMGEFSVGHAGFMAIGAYVSSVMSVRLLGSDYFFPVYIVCGGLLASLAGLVIAASSFRIRGDYLAIITLSFNMIIKSGFENIDYLGGPRGFLGMARLTTPVWVYIFTILSIVIIRNFIYSRYGRAMLSIREDETVSALMTVNTKEVKVIAFMLSSFFAGVAGGLYAHLLQFISPRTFDIIKSTEMLVMVYLGGVCSITGSIIGATLFTILIELFRPLGVWRMAVMPLMLVLLMLFRPLGIMGFRELGITPEKDG